MRRFSTKQPQIHCLVSIPSQARWEISRCNIKVHILQDCMLEGKKVGEVQQEKLKTEISFSEIGGAAWLFTKQFQSVGPVLPQCSLRAQGPRGTTAAVQVCAGRERGGNFFFSSSFSDSWSVRSWERDALKQSLCLAEASVEGGTAGNGL